MKPARVHPNPYRNMSSRQRAFAVAGAGGTFATGGASRDRTGDLLVANKTLSQLSYGPLPDAEPNAVGRCFRHAWRREICHACWRAIWWVWQELHLRPHPYQGCALTN